MIKYVLRKLASWTLMIFIATNITYFLANMFLDPRARYMEMKPPPKEEVILAKLQPLNLNPTESIFVRWWRWISGIFTQWDWGKDPMGVPVNGEIAYRIWVSAELVIGATIIATILGISLGIYTASRQYKFADRFWQGVSIVALNLHVIVASMLVVFLALWINKKAGTTVFYVTGAANIGVEGTWHKFLDALRHVAMPTLALVMVSFAGTHMLQRSLLLDNINADYVRTARAKGLTRHAAIRKHAMRTSIIPVATQIAFSIPGIFGGAILTETIFAWNGMGKYSVATITTNNIHGLVAASAFGALLTAIGATLADIAVVALDPRVRVS
ncbi:ABC transporter permease [Boudabousia liubingyangii]|uniref:ABC transporter permease n=1 Tax=Boudabousia liubingyangii TaxID=1921764 RepID=A0A1Q5PKZ0_9ACTO|nr:ABC transporter permease [Boudabousia liubingyangii]OKL46372.1 ABC transporter permease [Boudabousia liubingyangii]OKL47305.1 ABC transporter permease [Boudabousia liubingyangii]